MKKTEFKNIESIRISDVEDLKELLKLFIFEEDIQRTRSSYVFRGLPNVDYHLHTSLQRNCKSKKEILEKSLLRNFAKYAIAENSLIGDSIWYQLAIGQHHGLPTRLLDWTYSPLMALNFAVSEQSFDEFDKHDCLIWAVHVGEMNKLLPDKYQQKLIEERAYLFTIDMLKEVAVDLSEYDKDMSDNKLGHSAMVFLEPPSIDQRIINQYSYFSIVPSHMESSAGSIELFIDKNTLKTKLIVIDKSIRWTIRDMLDTLNINERIVYPGLDGIAAWLKRHYYVK